MRPRHRTHFKRLLFRSLFGCAAIPALLLLVRFAWGLEAAARLAAERTRVRALDIPVLPPDWPDPNKVPPSDDALVPFRAAIAAITLTDDERRLLSDVPSPTDVTWTDPQTGALKHLWTKCSLALTELDLAAGHATAAWPVDLDALYGRNGDAHTWSIYSGANLEEILAGMAIVYATEHRWPDFFTNLRRLCTIARIFDQSTRPWDLNGATLTRNRTLRLLERFETDIPWHDPAVAAAARQLLDDLRPANTANMARLWNVRLLNDQWEIHKPAYRSQWWLKPLLDDDEARQLTSYAALAPALRADSWPQFHARLVTPAALRTSSRLAEIARLFSAESDVEYEGRAHFHGLATVRAFSILLAAHLYQHDHGQLPATADLLVPAYLPVLPLDPFDASNQPIRYRLDPVGPTLWSIGEDGVDNGGKSFPSNSGLARFRGPDILFGAAWRDLLISPPLPNP